MSNLEKYNNPDNYIMVTKKIFDRQVYMPEIGTEIFNHLENSTYTVDENKPYVLIGSKGEEWCVDKKQLLKAYELTEEDLEKFHVGMEPETITTRPGVPQWATHIDLDEQIKVQTSWGEILTSNIGEGHGLGDWIVCQDRDGAPNFDDRWILNGEIFEETMNIICCERAEEYFRKEFGEERIQEFDAIEIE